jgi:ribosome modulation factor
MFIAVSGNRVVANQPWAVFFITTICLFCMAWIGFLGKSPYSDGYDTGYAEGKTSVAASAEIGGDSPAYKKWRNAKDRSEAEYQKKSDNQQWLKGYRDGLQAGLGKYAVQLE